MHEWVDDGSNYAIRCERCQKCSMRRWGKPGEESWYYEVRLPEMWKMVAEPPCGCGALDR